MTENWVKWHYDEYMRRKKLDEEMLKKMMKELKLVRVRYGKPDTPEDMREYQIDGVGPVGTINEFKDVFPNHTFKIIDNISKKETDIKKLKKVLD